MGLQAEFLEGFAAMDSSVTSRNGSPLPASIPAKVHHVMADNVILGPDREAGLSYVDSLYWGKGDNVFFAEDSSAPGGYNVPFGSFHRAADQELTGWFDASASLTLSVPYTPQEYYDAQTSKHMIL